jgi:hypothetical protein
MLCFDGGGCVGSGGMGPPSAVSIEIDQFGRSSTCTQLGTDGPWPAAAGRPGAPSAPAAAGPPGTRSPPGASPPVVCFGVWGLRFRGGKGVWGKAMGRTSSSVSPPDAASPNALLLVAVVVLPPFAITQFQWGAGPLIADDGSTKFGREDQRQRNSKRGPQDGCSPLVPVCCCGCETDQISAGVGCVHLRNQGKLFGEGPNVQIENHGRRESTC